MWYSKNHKEGERMPNRHEISDADWEQIKYMLPPENTGEVGPSKPRACSRTDANWAILTKPLLKQVKRS